MKEVLRGRRALQPPKPGCLQAFFFYASERATLHLSAPVGASAKLDAQGAWNTCE
jgi:hypothetical protein